ncbi:unnamed protein product [Prunus armeniaca]|uniref:Uncharacterized protein n=1 Tax=Prunus armeniaca TaxID=36596 RepID=A0A6J5V4S8_PRUAR|nr:unnamed protein product [Prunus armeniaca]
MAVSEQCDNFQGNQTQLGKPCSLLPRKIKAVSFAKAWHLEYRKHCKVHLTILDGCRAPGMPGVEDGLYGNHGPIYFVGTKKFFSKIGLARHITKIHSEASIEHNAWELKQYVEELYWGSGKSMMLLGKARKLAPLVPLHMD